VCMVMHVCGCMHGFVCLCVCDEYGVRYVCVLWRVQYSLCVRLCVCVEEFLMFADTLRARGGEPAPGKRGAAGWEGSSSDISKPSVFVETDGKF